LRVLVSEERKDLFMQALISRFVRRESGVTAYGLIVAALMLIGVGAWIVATAPRVVASPQIGINPLQMMGNAGNLPTSSYDDAISSGDHVASLVESPKKQQRRVKKSH
jgi:Flp pilus assembly pilin Flp